MAFSSLNAQQVAALKKLMPTTPGNPLQYVTSSRRVEWLQRREDDYKKRSYRLDTDAPDFDKEPAAKKPKKAYANVRNDAAELDDLKDELAEARAESKALKSQLRALRALQE